MKIAIVDTLTTGHHLEYIYGLCSEISKREVENTIDVFCDDYLFTYMEENDLRKFEEQDNFKIKSGVLEQARGNWVQVTKNAYRNIKRVENYDRIIFLTLNYYFFALYIYSLFNTITFSVSGIFFDPHIRKRNDKKNWFRNYVLKHIISNYNSNIYVLNDENAAKKLNKKYTTDSFQVLCDPIPEFYYDDLDSTDIHDGNLTTFSMIGSISRRKGVFEFLEAIKRCSKDNRYLLAGKVDDEILSELERQIKVLKKDGVRIDLENKFLSNKEFAQTILESDVLVMPYLTKGASSGIVGHAAFNGKPVIGPNHGYLKILIDKYYLGITINPKDINLFSECLEEKRNFSNNFNRMKSKMYYQKNSIKKFLEKLF